MQKLRGSGTTFSTSGKRWKPFMSNPVVAKRNAKAHRMIKAGTLKPMTKAEMRKIAAALATEPPQIVPVDYDPRPGAINRSR